MEHQVSNNALVGIEHPCIVNSVEKAIKSLGGDRQLQNLVNSQQNDAQARLYLKPNDPFATPILSEPLSTNDLLLQIEVPKLVRVRRKRKALNGDTPELLADGSVGDTPLPRTDSKRLRQALGDVPDRCKFEFVGHVSHTHRFRNMVDFAFAASAGAFAQDFATKVAPFDYDLVKQFSIKPDATLVPPTELMPPPRLSTFNIPFNYRYRQNPAVKQVVDESGNVELVNEQKAHKTFTPMLVYNTETVPAKVPPQSEKLEDVSPELRELVGELKKRFDERPIWTRRALTNVINRDEWRNMYKYGYEHVAYMFRSGPWREALVKLGVDPRTDPQYRIYQTMMFQFEESTGAHKANQKQTPRRRGGARERKANNQEEKGPSTSHIFDGKTVSLDGRVWQVIDITDPMLQDILGTDLVRQTCHIKIDGWFQNGTWAKARTIAKAKMQALARNELGPPQGELERIAAIPDIITAANREVTLPMRNDTQHFMNLSNNLRTITTAPEEGVSGGKPKGRGSQSGLGPAHTQRDLSGHAGPSYEDFIEQVEEEEGDDDDDDEEMDDIEDEVRGSEESGDDE